jgi:hypothetical protein
MKISEFYQQYGRAVLMSWVLEQLKYEAYTGILYRTPMWADLLKAGALDWKLNLHTHDASNGEPTQLSACIESYLDPEYPELTAECVGELSDQF